MVSDAQEGGCGRVGREILVDGRRAKRQADGYFSGEGDDLGEGFRRILGFENRNGAFTTAVPVATRDIPSLATGTDKKS